MHSTVTCKLQLWHFWWGLNQEIFHAFVKVRHRTSPVGDETHLSSRGLVLWLYDRAMWGQLRSNQFSLQCDMPLVFFFGMFHDFPTKSLFSIIFHYREASKACFCRHDMTEAAACEVPLASSHHLLPKSCGSAYTASVSVDGLRAFILTRQTGLWHAVAYFRNMVNLVFLLLSRDMYGGMIHNNYYINHHPIAPFAIYDIR